MPGVPVIKVHGLKKYFELRKGFFSFMTEPVIVKAVDDVDFVIHEGEILGLVGESGCGKTTTGRLLTRLEYPTAGNVFFQGRDIALLEAEDLKIFRRNIQMVFQDPYESLNPRNTVLQTVMEPLVNHNIGDSFENRVMIVTKALEDAGLAPAKEYLARFPHELSGGQRQRVSIARALVMNPRVIVADEPVSMLDVSIRAGVLNLMLDLRDKYHIPYLFITHDIAVARYVSDRLGVMYLGKIVELAETDEVVFKSKHPYTQALLSAVPVPDPTHKHGRVSIKGEIPSAIDVPLGCRFRPRCPKAFNECGFQGNDLVDWLMGEEKFNDQKHPMSRHIGELHPDGFSLVIMIKPGGSASKVKDFFISKIAELKDKNPMFQAIWSAEESLGNWEMTIRCSSVNISGDELAQELLDRLTAIVDFRDRDHPMFGTILDARREGAKVLLAISKEEKQVAPAGKSKVDTTLGFLQDFVKHHKAIGFAEFRGVAEVKGEPGTRQVVAYCKSARIPGKRVAQEIADAITKDITNNPSSAFFNSLLPIQAKGNRLVVKTPGERRRWEELEKELKGYLRAQEEAGRTHARGVKEIRSGAAKGPKDTVVVRFVIAEEPPLIDIGGGHLVACYLYKSAAG